MTAMRDESLRFGADLNDFNSPQAAPWKDSSMTFSRSLSRAQQELVELMHDVNSGRIENLVVRVGRPVMSAPNIVREIKPMKSEEDQAIEGPVLALLDILENLGDGVIDRIEIEDGLPTSVVLAGARTVLRDSSNRPIWLTVTEATKLLLRDVSGADLSKARARVSRAADAGKFRTNGEKGRRRRIDRDSFSTWRLEQRDQDGAVLD